MRKFYRILIAIPLVFSLAACRLNATGGGVSVEPTLSNAQVQTQISTVLTAQPTQASEQASNPTNTPVLATVENIIVQNTQPASPTATAEGATQAPTATSEAPANSTPTPPPTLTPTSGPTPTTGPSPTPSKDDPRTKLGSPTATDPMDNSTKWVWPTATNEFTSIDFSGGMMTLTSSKSITGWRIANPTGQEFGDLYLEATVKTGTCASNDQYGIIARVPVLKDANQGIMFGFTCDGHYSLRLWDGTVGVKGQMTRLVDWTASKAINAGSNQTNRIGLMMVGSRLLMYANGTLLGEASSSVYPSGFFGLFIGGLATPDFAIQVDQMSYWDNPKP